MTKTTLIASSLALAGMLSLSAMAPAFAIPVNKDGVPDGPYLSSCTDVKVSSGWVSATCTKADGSTKKSSIHFKDCIEPVENRNGSLWCRAL